MREKCLVYEGADCKESKNPNCLRCLVTEGLAATDKEDIEEAHLAVLGMLKNFTKWRRWVESGDPGKMQKALQEMGITPGEVRAVIRQLGSIYPPA